LLTTIIGALLPMMVILILGFFSGWHKDFTGDQATTLNRMVMLYALPLLLFGSTVTISRSRLLENVPLALAVAAGTIGSFVVVLLPARFVFQRDLGTSALQALTIGGPAVPFVCVSVLGYAFGPAKRIDPCHQRQPGNESRASACLRHTSLGGGHTERRRESGQAILTFSCGRCCSGAHCPGPAIILVIGGIRLPKVVSQSMLLLGQATGGVALFASGIYAFSRGVCRSTGQLL
jgi:malonate transporter